MLMLCQYSLSLFLSLNLLRKHTKHTFNRIQELKENNTKNKGSNIR